MSIKIEHRVEIVNGKITRDKFFLRNGDGSAMGDFELGLEAKEIQDLISEVERIKSQLEKK